MKALWKGKVRKRPTHKIGAKALKLLKDGKTFAQISKELDPYCDKYDEFGIRNLILRTEKRLQKRNIKRAPLKI